MWLTEKSMLVVVASVVVVVGVVVGVVNTLLSMQDEAAGDGEVIADDVRTSVHQGLVKSQTDR